MAIKFENVSYVYSPGSPLEVIGLDQLNFSLEEGKFIALVGHTGSGKSTLMQHFNALLKPTSGKIEIAGYTITPETGNKGLKDLRRKVSLAFQFPEAQLFENTVLKDVEYGPRNFGFSEDEAREAALKWLKKVGLKDDLIEHSPFDLSGGQMRRVALAGVLAYEPEIICLDEPAAGLDPMGRLEMMQLFKDYQAAGHTVILVTHNMDDVADYADDVLFLEHGRLIKHASPKEVFKDSEWLQKHHLAEPRSARFAAKLEAAGLKLPGQPLTMPELADAIKQSLKGGEHE